MIKGDSVYLIAGLVLIIAGLNFIYTSGIFTSVTGALLSNATNITNATLQNASAVVP